MQELAVDQPDFLDRGGNTRVRLSVIGIFEHVFTVRDFCPRGSKSPKL